MNQRAKNVGEIDRLFKIALRRDGLKSDEALAKLSWIARGDIGESFDKRKIPWRPLPLLRLSERVRIAIKSMKIYRNGQFSIEMKDSGYALTKLAEYHGLK